MLFSESNTSKLMNSKVDEIFWLTTIPEGLFKQYWNSCGLPNGN